MRLIAGFIAGAVLGSAAVALHSSMTIEKAELAAAHSSNGPCVSEHWKRSLGDDFHVKCEVPKRLIVDSMGDSADCLCPERNPPRETANDPGPKREHGFYTTLDNGQKYYTTTDGHVYLINQ